jgi:hypothetical protein
MGNVRIPSALAAERDGGVLSDCACPRALVAKRGDVRIREKEGFNCPRF